MNITIKMFREYCLNATLPPAVKRLQSRIYARPIQIIRIRPWPPAVKFGHAMPMLTIFLGMLLLPQTIVADNLYWDVNGATAGSGGASPSGSWDTSTPNWNTNSAGTSATTVWTDGNVAIFSAGSDATGSYTITLSGTQSPSGVTFQSGTATLAGGILSLGAGTVAVNNGLKGIIGSTISGSAGLNKISTGELVLTAANNFTGNLTNQAGTLTLNNNSAASSGSIVFNPGVGNTAVLTSSNAAISIGNDI
jgi:autotransporter-associated beta strand protein